MGEKYVGFRMDSEEYYKAEAQWKRAGFKSLKEAGRYALQNAFQEGPDADAPAKYRPHLKKLAKVLATADAKTAEALDVILEGLLNLKRAKAARTERM